MNFKNVRQKTLAAAMTMMVSGCGYYNEVLQKPGAGVQPFKKGETLGFGVVNAILVRNLCLDCHTVAKGNRGGVNLENYANASALAAGLLATTKSGFMPLGGPRVPVADVEVLQAWVDAGAPESSTLPLPGAEVPVPAPAPAPGSPNPPLPGGETPERITFVEVSASIFVPHCVGCHSSMNNYARVAGRLVEIQRAIDTNSMPKNNPPLDAQLKTMLASWIAAGAPEQ